MGSRLVTTTLVAVALAVSPAAAAAGTAKLVRQPGNEREPASEAFDYTAAPGEVNRLTLAMDDDAVLVTDPAGVGLGRGCTRVAGDPARARCKSPRNSDIEGLSASLGDRDDTAEDTTGADIEGGAGNDVMTGRGVTGGTGGSAAGLSGGPGEDTLRSESVKGGPGDDTLVISYTYADTGFGVIDESDPNNGSDVITGGALRDFVRYSDRRAPVRVDLRETSGAGEAGENDRITGVESADGGRGDDVLIGTDGPNELSGGGGSDEISGGPGDDFLFADSIASAGRRTDSDRIDGGLGDDDIGGSDGPNAIDAGGGEDTVVGAGGSDRIIVRDRSIDSVSCSSGRRDHVRADGLDFVPLSCERLRRKGAARAVPLTVSVGSQDDLGPGVSSGCSIDGPKVCRARVSLYRGGRLQATRGLRARRGRTGFALFPKRLRRLEGKRVRVVVTARGRDGRSRRAVRTFVVDTQG